MMILYISLKRYFYLNNKSFILQIMPHGHFDYWFKAIKDSKAILQQQWLVYKKLYYTKKNRINVAKMY